ncbi:nicotinate phosphoribosyltransferase NDAI_0E01540 [Naumovozyma dairenensis CBS 421]|uniref:Nicotinate phosphoribosyltransferase n=1 Tax=Naumovozyma dairenensis (strain ATCC 10597 / BCRC 20456 / CBS 421 / NBRC 0211 / NRRL Y-12639) TaxID=1071378 RepID=G0WB50_NAUDC|nr:hypothetical protein NDAI_0E01540 [Naumovozyma dairenensis CBS 421]CCD24970.1 hypothetical protein NDAI_0E01540 [Naumovozyma dairenensis CBS 421]
MADNGEQKCVIQSILDTDLYKITMQAAVLKHFPNVKVIYKYTNRSPQFTFNKASIDWLNIQFKLLETIQVTPDEIKYLKDKVPYLPDSFMKYIGQKDFRLRPSEQLDFQYELVPGTKDEYTLKLFVEGYWKDTIMYEIPLLALISEAYFRFIDKDWDYEGQEQMAFEKANTLFEHNCSFTEFGSRRRRSLHGQDLVMQGIVRASKLSPNNEKLLLGTSNVYFAKKYDILPVGTVAHEWFMGIAALTGDYINANKDAMDYWIETFGKEHAGLALTDTFGTDDYLKNFKPPYTDYYFGVRQDSGDPIEFTEKIAHFYNDELKLPKFSKTICYSDSLNVEKVIKYDEVARKYGFKATFGIGTSFTNDYRKKSDPAVKSEPLNIVIKLLTVDGKHAIKLSDNLGKNMGDPETVQRVKKELGYIEREWEGISEAHRWS